MTPPLANVTYAQRPSAATIVEQSTRYNKTAVEQRARARANNARSRLYDAQKKTTTLNPLDIRRLVSEHTCGRARDLRTTTSEVARAAGQRAFNTSPLEQSIRARAF